MWGSFNICGKDIEVDGITVVVSPKAFYDNSYITIPYKIGGVRSIFYPERTMPENLLPGYAEDIVRKHKEDRASFFIATSSVTLIRAIECLTDLYEVMGSLDVLCIRRNGNDIGVENVMYSEYGISSLYEEILSPLNLIEGRLRDKYKTYST